MNGIFSNQRYVNLAKVNDVILGNNSVVNEDGNVILDEILALLLEQIANTLAENNYTKQEVNDLIANRSGFAIVQALPTTNISPNKIYLVAITNDTDDTDNDAYDEYIYANNKWEHVGSFQHNFAAYSTTAEVQEMLNNTLSGVQGDFETLQNNFTALQNHVGDIDAVLDAINGEVV